MNLQTSRLVCAGAERNSHVLAVPITDIEKTLRTIRGVPSEVADKDLDPWVKEQLERILNAMTVLDSVQKGWRKVHEATIQYGRRAGHEGRNERRPRVPDGGMSCTRKRQAEPTEAPVSLRGRLMVKTAATLVKQRKADAPAEERTPTNCVWRLIPKPQT